MDARDKRYDEEIEVRHRRSEVSGVKVVILAGGFGTRISEETSVIPKPLVEIGGRPLLWHIMKLYSYYGLNDFIICCGYKGHLIKKYFTDYYFHNSDITIDLSTGVTTTHRRCPEQWQITLVDTGEASMTGGRLKRVRDHVGRKTFCLTYGDGVSNVDIAALIRHHRQQAALATVTAVHMPGRFGALDLSADRPRISSFREKSASDGNLINGGFFVLEPEVLDLIVDDSTVFEQGPLERLVADDQLAVYPHLGFWQNVDTLRDKMVLQGMWDSGEHPWCVWEAADPDRSPAARSISTQ
ncbi:MAG: glucose-1-phosphate cytidylyltransferase [Afipia sp.]|nr:glucose-1-phosphate cytidylyltransferase [Afipia sp.]